MQRASVDGEVQLQAAFGREDDAGLDITAAQADVGEIAKHRNIAAFRTKFNRDATFHARIGAAVLAVGLLLLLEIHAAIGFGEQFLGIEAVLRIHRAAHAERKDVFLADFLPDLAGEVAHLVGFLQGGFRVQSGGDHNKLVSAHAGHIVVFAARLPQGLGEQTQHAIAFEVAEAIVDLLEPVHVANHDGERGFFALAAGEFLVEFEEQGTRVG